MLPKHEMEVPNAWQTAWLDRTYDPLRDYIIVISYALSLSIIGLGIATFLTIRKSSLDLTVDPSARASTFQTMNKKVMRITKGHFFVALLYLANVIVFTGIDAVLCFMFLKEDVAANPEVWDSAFVMEVVVYVLYLFGLFMIAFTVFPLVQMLLATKFLIRVGKKHNLESFVPEARFFSTHVAQIWCMLSFFVVSWWAPHDERHTTVRYIIIQACFGSALAWLEASFAFNFHSDSLEQEDLDRASGGVKDVISLFGKTVRAAHTSFDKNQLPKYEDVATEGQALLAEKE